jgi:cell division protein FtsN
MLTNKSLLAFSCALLIGLSGCSRQQSDWQKTREANSAESYEQFLKKYPSGEFTAQAQARLKDLSEERDWQKARDTDTADAYQAFLKQYPEGKWTEEARIRVENFTLAQTPSGATASGAGAPASGAPSVGSGTPDAGATPPAQGSGNSAVPGGSMMTRPPPAIAANSSARPPKKTPSSAASPTGSAVPVSKGDFAVQLGAFKSGTEAADKRWAHLQREYPKLLAGLSFKVVTKNNASGTLYRLQAVGLSEAHAREICKILKAKSQPCVVVRPASA